MEDAVVVNIYWYVIITALVWLPLTIQIICYSAIFVKVHTDIIQIIDSSKMYCVLAQ